MSARYALLVEQLENLNVFWPDFTSRHAVSSFMPTKSFQEGFHAHIQSPPFHGDVLGALCAYKHFDAQDLTLRT
ncbi:uncharacterized protein JCM10292_002193 [Rhodotorula paludigena]|uniref:uncharacterized protein n=1 Tax=Rhodotorula paludigena TaxID=86838 RepID=UPI00317A512F